MRLINLPRAAASVRDSVGAVVARSAGALGNAMCVCDAPRALRCPPTAPPACVHASAIARC
jgi:hypothetical protein